MSKTPLPPNWEVPADIRSRLGEKAGRQRAMFAEGHLLLVLHAPPRADENERVGRFYWRRPEGTWQSSEPAGAGTLGKHLEEIAKRLDTLDHSVDAATLARDYFAVISHLSPLVRTTRNLHKTLQDARELVGDNAELITFRDRAYDLERLAELLYEDAKNGLDFATAKRTEEQSAASHRMEVSAHRLNLLAAFFFPLATLAAVLDVVIGERLTHLWPAEDVLGFVGLGIALGLVLTVIMSLKMPSFDKPTKDPYEKQI